jgi:hypothetical protein
MVDAGAADLPDPFQFESGRRVKTLADWRERRRELTELVVGIEYGGLPPSPSGVTGEPLHTHKVARFGDAVYTQYRLLNNDDLSFHFRLDVLVPPGQGPFPVVLTGDGCYRFVTDDITLDILRRGFILAQFSRTAIVPDVYSSERTAALYRVYPDHQIAAWISSSPSTSSGMTELPWLGTREAERLPCWLAQPTNVSHSPRPMDLDRGARAVFAGKVRIQKHSPTVSG